MAKAKSAAPKKAAKKSKKAVAVVPAVAPEVVVPRTYGAILADARPAYDSKKNDPKVVIDPKYEGEIMEVCDPGSEFVRIENGWRVKFIEDGVTVTSSGPSIIEALLAYGEQIDHAAEAARARAKSEAALAAIGAEPAVAPETKAEKKARIAAEKKAAADAKKAAKAAA